MKHIFRPIFQSVVTRRDVKLFMAFTFLPFITSLLINAEGIETAFKTDKTVSLISFMVSDLTFQMNTILPNILLAFVIYSVFREEFDSGIMFLYKDIKRSSIFKAKIFSLTALYGLYLLMTTVISCLAYYLLAVPKYQFSGNLLPDNPLATQAVLLQLLAIIGLNLVIIMAVSALSLKYKVGVATMVGVMIALWASVAPQFKTVRYFFPTGYATMLDQFSFSVALLISLGLITLYLTIATIFTYKNFMKKEF